MTDEQEFIAKKVYALLKEKPGLTPTQISRALGIGRHRVINALIFMEELDLMVSEDDSGRVYPFEEDCSYGGR
jgi:predicted transcriptional regulator